MSKFSLLLLAGTMVTGLTAIAPSAQAQVAVGVQIGPAPVCPYGYYAEPPYECAPYGYYGPDWFVNGVFLGAGPWYHGREHFYGHVDNHFRRDHGYNGPFPGRGEAATHPTNHISHFHGNERRDGHGNRK